MLPIRHERTVEPYAKYSEFYDFLLKDELDYDGDCDFIELALAKLGRLGPLRILDIGCGTGEDVIRLMRRGHEATSIDVSTGMVNEAIKKAKSEGVQAEFFVQDMRGIKLNRIFDCATSLRGSFARLIGDADFKLFFEGLNAHLRSGGLFIFDFINTEGVILGHKDWKLKDKEGLVVIRLDGSDFQQDKNLLTERHEFFVIENAKLVDRFTEIHELRTHRVDEMSTLSFITSLIPFSLALSAF